MTRRIRQRLAEILGVLALFSRLIAASQDQPTAEHLLARLDSYFETYHDALGKLVADERLVQEVERAAQPVRAGERHERGARQIEAQDRVAHPGQCERGGDVGDQQVLRHVGAQDVVAERIQRREQPDDPARHRDVPADDLAGRHLDAAPVQDPQRAQVQPLGHAERDEDPRVERHAQQCGAT